MILKCEGFGEMENSTLQSKCGSMWQASQPSLSQLQSQPQEITSTNHRMVQEAMLPWNSHSNFDNSGRFELGSSFLSLLSRPPSLLHSDLQPSPSSKSIVAASNSPNHSKKARSFAYGIGVPLLSSGLLTPNLDSQNAEAGADLSSSFSSKAMLAKCSTRSGLSSGLLTPNLDSQNAEAGADLSSSFSSKTMLAKCSTRSGLNNVLPVAGLNSQKSEQVLQIIDQKVPITETAKDLFPLREGSISGNFPGNIGGLRNGTNAESRQSSALSSGCPRVFCLSASGYLLLSINGLLGVVCACHGLHMSVSKFSEHSGLCNANPGDAVSMGSGETIAQWRKDYFQKFGISVPGDYSGWDWPEGFSVTASKYIPTFPDISISSDVSRQVSSFGASELSGQYRNNVAFSEHPNTGRDVVDEVLHDKKQWNCLQGHNFLFKGLNSTSFSNFDSVTDKKVMSRLVSGGSTMSSLVGVRGADNVCQSTSGYKDSNSTFRNSYISFSDLQNLKSPGKSFSGGNFEGPIVYRDSVSSNFELRLGQPSVQSQTPECSSLVASGSNQIGAPWEAKSSVLVDQLHKLADSSDGISRSIFEREQSRFHQNHLAGIYSSTYASQVDRYDGDVARVSANPVFLLPLKYHEENVNPKVTNIVMNGLPLKYHEENVNPKVTNIVMNGSHAVAGKHHCESHNAKGDNFGFPRSCVLDQEFHGNALYGENKNGKGVGCALDNSRIAAEQNISYSRKFKEISFLNEVMGGSGHKSYLEDSSLNTWQFSGMTGNASDVKCLGKISCPEHHGHSGYEFPKTISSHIDSGVSLASQAMLAGSPCTNSNSIHSVTPAFSNKGSICARQCSLHASLQMFASQHSLEFPNHNHTSASRETIPEQHMFKKSCDKTHVSIASSTLKGQHYGYNFASIPSSSRVASESHTSRLAYWMGSNNEKLAPVAGSSKLCNFSALSQRMPLPIGGTKMQCQLSRVAYPTEQPLLRFSGSKDEITLPSTPGKCFQAEPYTYFPGKCSCATQTDGLEKNYNFKDGTSATASKELGGSAVGMATTLYASNINQMYDHPNESSFGQDRDLLGQRMKKVECTPFQWRDVPRKMKETCGPMSKEQPTGPVNRNGNVEGRTPNAVAADANCFNTSAQDAESRKELEVSNIFSGWSAPVVTQISIGIDNKDSPTVDAVDTRCMNNLVVDEGSRIDRCCSSDDGLDSERSAGFCGFASIINSMDVRPTERISCESSRSLIDELRLRDSLRLKKMQSRCPSLTIQEKSNHVQTSEICSRKRKKRRMMKWKRLNASFPPSSQSSAHKGSPKCTGSNEWHSRALKDMEMHLRNDQGSSNNCACSAEPSSKRRKSAFSPSAISLGRDLHRVNHHGDVDIDNHTKKKINHDNLEALEVIRRKRLRLASADPTINQVHSNESSSLDAEITGTSSGKQFNICKQIARPIVCGKYGIISNGSPSKPAKIVCMKRILIAAKNSSIAENAKWNLSSVNKFKKTNTTECDGCFTEPSSVEKELHSGDRGVVTNRAESSRALLSKLNPLCSLGETEIACPNAGKECESLSYVMQKRSHDRYDEKHSARNSCFTTQLKPKSKEIRKRSLYELTVTGKDSSSSNFSTLKNSTPLWQRRRRYNGKLVKNAADVIRNAKKCMKDEHCLSAWDLDAFCCVCGSSDKDKSNYLVKCNNCSIKVHQACYGISKVPKAHWYCRPCKTSSKDIACVICGYGGGAMTCAMRSHNIVKSLLQAWNIDYEIKPADSISSKALNNQLKLLSSSKSGAEGDSLSVTGLARMQSSLVLLGDMDPLKHLEDDDSMSSPRDSIVHNSITAGVHDPTVKQWVHMVCGLWTPGTRCPNVDTMSSFDVSGASCPKSNVVCSICNRPGGSCIRCRVADCSVCFHPWCAHQKGLLQSEAEGADNKNVGFYGRCMDHAMPKQSNADGYPTEEKKEFTCARTEGYKGRKRDGSQPIRPHCLDSSNGCHVPQEQLNAWLHINGQKSFLIGLPKLYKSDIEYDYRKEYARYKQSKDWKHLVVYKSGIHGLGLYTSQFISRGAMVVEYVGEIVGLRVADKRESEYQSGKKLQYKSACYFFRVDKEHIIDATRKGGIARFVNHSCLPNCVAKVISLRNEKKVVFFAERDIYPGEEITYDYHFNHEDEGKKIQCFCNSKNCRRYLN